jgi:hypothetical protein
MAQFNEKAQCFIDQYSGFSVKGPDGKNHPINGKVNPPFKKKACRVPPINPFWVV